jgi:hypothetical protein
MFCPVSALAGENGVMELVVDAKRDTATAHVPAGPLTLIYPDTAIKHVFNSNQGVFTAQILDTLNSAVIQHPVVMLQVPEATPPGTRGNLVLITDDYVLSLQLIVINQKKTDAHIVLDSSSLGAKTAIPTLSVSKPANCPAPRARSTHSSSASAIQRRSGLRFLNRTKIARGVTVRVHSIEWEKSAQSTVAYIVVDIENSSAKSLRISDITVGSSGQSAWKEYPKRVYWAIDSSPSVAQGQSHQDIAPNGSARGLVVIPDADAINAGTLALTVKVYDAAPSITVDGIPW